MLRMKAERNCLRNMSSSSSEEGPVLQGRGNAAGGGRYGKAPSHSRRESNGGRPVNSG